MVSFDYVDVDGIVAAEAILVVAVAVANNIVAFVAAVAVAVVEDLVADADDVVSGVAPEFEASADEQIGSVAVAAVDKDTTAVVAVEDADEACAVEDVCAYENDDDYDVDVAVVGVAYAFVAEDNAAEDNAFAAAVVADDNSTVADDSTAVAEDDNVDH